MDWQAGAIINRFYALIRRAGQSNSLLRLHVFDITMNFQKCFTNPLLIFILNFWIDGRISDFLDYRKRTLLDGFHN
jgi:hypothetical protein